MAEREARTVVVGASAAGLACAACLKKARIEPRVPRATLAPRRGFPERSGTEAAPGLYFCGYYVSPTGMLREIGIEAERIAASIAGGGARAAM